MCTYLHIHIFLSYIHWLYWESLETVRLQKPMSISSIHILVSKYYTPLKRTRDPWSSLVVQQVKDLELSLLRLRSQLWRGLDPWTQNFLKLWDDKNKKTTRTRESRTKSTKHLFVPKLKEVLIFKYFLKYLRWGGGPIMAQQKRSRLGTMRLQVQSLASLSGLRIQHCCELWCRSQTRLGSGAAAAVVWAGSCSSN